jgi:hypothetical protein
LNTFSEKLRLFQGLQGFLNTFLVELRLFLLCPCGFYTTYCRGGFLAPVYVFISCATKPVLEEKKLDP